MTEKLPISLVILSHNRIDEISKNLPELLSHLSGSDQIQVIIVDNNSTDGSIEYLLNLKKVYSSIEVIVNPENFGVAKGRNTGYLVANRDLIVSLDDDSRIAYNDLLLIPKLFDKYSGFGLLAFKVINEARNEVQNPHGDLPCEVANHHGAGFAFRRKILDLVKGIDEECNFGAEELDFSIRIRNLGWRVLYTPEITINHNNYFRNKDIDQFRRIRRVYNNIRIFYKLFPAKMACKNSFRYLFLALRTWIVSYGIISSSSLFKAAFEGYRSGLQNHIEISKVVIDFYKDKKLRPEFGNVPIIDKIVDSLKRQYIDE